MNGLSYSTNDFPRFKTGLDPLAVSRIGRYFARVDRVVGNALHRL